MDTMRICKQCRQPMPENAPEGLCPSCLAKVALGSEPAGPGATINIDPLAGQAAPDARIAPDVAQLAAQFPQLEIIELLGMGGMGMVYKARQPHLDRFVALKILPMESAPHPSFAERFSREAKALAKLNHPGIVNVFDFGRTGQYYYFVMEYVDGMNLRQLLQSQTIEPRQALELVTQICTALQFAHDEGVVHRDIKPENILLNKKGQVKIADFGLAKLLGATPDSALTMSQAAMGTINYMAPEQRQNAQGVDHRADIYSLGVVFYEMLTGEVPMGRFEPPSKRVQVDVRLDEVVLRALEREPARRYQQASEVKSGVESITSAGGGTPPKPERDASSTAVQWFLVRATGLFLVGWLMAKWLWNFRSPGCWLASCGMAYLVIWVCLRRLRFFPQQWADYSKRPASKRFLGLVPNFLALTLGFFFFIGAFCMFWDDARNSGLARTEEQYESQYKGKEYRLLRNLPAFSKEIPNVEMVGSHSYSSFGGITWELPGPVHHYDALVPDLIFSCLLLFWNTLSILGAIQTRKTESGQKTVLFSWPRARASLAIDASVLMLLAPLFCFTEVAYGVSELGIRPNQPIAAASESFFGRLYQTNMEAVSQVIDKWAGKNGYAMGDNDLWFITTVPMGKRVAEAGLREAWKASPFDRWRSTWNSFHSLSPHLAFELVSSETPTETHVSVMANLSQQVPKDLIAALNKLPSVEASAPGVNGTPATKDP